MRGGFCTICQRKFSSGHCSCGWTADATLNRREGSRVI